MLYNDSESRVRQSTQEYWFGTNSEQGTPPTPGEYLTKPLLVCQIHQSEKLLNGKSVAIVGNSGKVLHSNHGEAIDAHDAVIRFNWAPSEGYEAQVGTKTTIRISNTHFLKAVIDEEFDKKMSKNYTGWNKDFYFTRENETIVLKRMSEYVNSPETDWKIKKRVEELGNNVVDCFDNRFLIYCGAMGPKSCSMGLLGVAMALANRDDGGGASSIDCYGFNFYEEDEEDRHYYDVMTQTKEKQAESHDFGHEKAIFKMLEKEGMIKVHD